MTDVELLIQEYRKCHIPYKVVVYLCGCKYIYITDKENRILENHSFCPDHEVGKKYMLLWCDACGVALRVIPRAGYRQKWCVACAKDYLKQYNQKMWQEKHGKKNKKVLVPIAQRLLALKKEKSMDKYRYRMFLKSLGRLLPVVETPILDKLIHETRSEK
ncbi:MAG: hypothetical protein JRG81_00235 [Deltaproteobacteria bacterium]|nr:hypothetical protein [Deltaproteobacteria bacterium]MBW2363505.1 hypothetical protein [Deltaproteobacteria bacterium]